MRGQSAGPDDGTEEAPGSEPAFDLAEALGRVDGDAEFLSTLADLFVGTLPGYLDAIRGAVASGDADAARRAAHAIKGSAANFGAQETCSAAQSLESAAQSGDLSMTAAAVEALDRALARLIPELDALRMP